MNRSARIPVTLIVSGSGSSSAGRALAVEAKVFFAVVAQR
jgi:hypothetical protein